ncbi:MAG: cytochrome c oxidase subunit II [Cellvibrionales bacterium]|nr:cytochrome c oxidase subunit II [Cellvibrionales bacterium]
MTKKGIVALSALISTLSLSLPGLANVERFETNMTESITDVGKEIYDIHMLVFWICVAAGILVFLFMLYTIIKYRKSNGHKPATFHENTAVEITWTVIPLIILLGMAWPASKTLIKIYDTSEADMDILITGYQWKWRYEYLTNDENDNVSFFSVLSTPQDEIHNIDPKNNNYLLEVDKPLVLPVNKKVRFLITANDVIHAWWVPALAVKKDAIPGFVNETWATPKETGIYRGQCAELCGKDHGFMPIVVDIRSEEDFNAWLKEEQAKAAEIKALTSKVFSMKELYDEGEKVYQKACLACHGANGEGGIGKAIAKSAIAMGDINTHMDVIVNGVPGTAMQAFGSQLTDVELAAVTTFQRNAFGNNMNETVQPIDIYNLKQGQ